MTTDKTDHSVSPDLRDRLLIAVENAAMEAADLTNTAGGHAAVERMRVQIEAAIGAALQASPAPEGPSTVTTATHDWADHALPLPAESSAERLDGLDEAVEATAAIRDFFIVRYRYVYGTGGGKTDEEMDAASKRLLEAGEALAARLAAQAQPSGSRAGSRE